MPILISNAYGPISAVRSMSSRSVSVRSEEPISTRTEGDKISSSGQRRSRDTCLRDDAD